MKGLLIEISRVWDLVSSREEDIKKLTAELVMAKSFVESYKLIYESAERECDRLRENYEVAASNRDHHLKIREAARANYNEVLKQLKESRAEVEALKALEEESEELQNQLLPYM